MFTKKTKRRVNLFLMILVLLFTCAKLVAEEISQSNYSDGNARDVASPHTQYKLLYTINAEYGEITQLPDKSYQLLLRKPHPNVSYSYNLNNKKSGLLPLTKFVTAWKKTEQINKTIKADLTGVQVDNKTIGHRQFYYIIALSKLHYDKSNSNLIFKLSLIIGNSAINSLEKFDNATLFINGCNLCACQESTIKCSPDFLN